MPHEQLTQSPEKQATDLARKMIAWFSVPRDQESALEQLTIFYSALSMLEINSIHAQNLKNRVESHARTALSKYDQRTKQIKS